MATQGPSVRSISDHEPKEEPDDIQIVIPSAAAAPSPRKPDTVQEYYPEGGFGWFVLVGSFVITFWMLGMNSVWGVFQEFFLAQGTFPGATSQSLTWVGSIGCACVYIAAPAIVYLNSTLGTKTVLSVGLVLGSIGFVCGSFATKTWHLYFTLAIPFGLGASFLYVTASTALNQYFYKRRALVAGIAASGSSIGGATLTPLIAHMCTQLGYKSTIRIMGGILIICVSVAAGCIRPLYAFSSTAPSLPPVVTAQMSALQEHTQEQGRRSPRNEIQEISPKTSDIEQAIVTAITPSKTTTAKIRLDFTVFESLDYTLLVFAAVLFALAYYAPIVLVPTYATSIGLSSGQAASLISVSTGTTVILRPIMGFVADRAGALNTMILSAFIAGLSCVALWMSAHTFTVLAIFMAVFGGFQGVLSLLFTVAASKTVTVDRMPSAMSFVIFATSLGYILGSPLTSLIVNAEYGGNRGAAIFVGVIDFVCFLLLVTIRWRTSRLLRAAV